jgi:hypothetical protein
MIDLPFPVASVCWSSPPSTVHPSASPLCAAAGSVNYAAIRKLLKKAMVLSACTRFCPPLPRSASRGDWSEMILLTTMPWAMHVYHLVVFYYHIYIKKSIYSYLRLIACVSSVLFVAIVGGCCWKFMMPNTCNCVIVAPCTGDFIVALPSTPTRV